MCGDEFEGSWKGIHGVLGYYSNYDGTTIDFDLCDACVDEMITHLQSKCKIDPLVYTD